MNTGNNFFSHQVNILGEHEESFDNDGKFVPSSIKPIIYETKDLYSVGRVTSINDDFIVFKNRDLLLRSATETIPNLTLQQECKYVTIESRQEIRGTLFESRVVELKSANSAEDDIDSLILMDDEYFKVPQDDKKNETRHVVIRNTSDKKIKLTRPQLDPANRSVDLQYRENATFTILPGRDFKVYLNIFPRKLGSRSFTLIADFSVEDRPIRKNCTVVLEVYHVEKNIISQRPPQINRFFDIKFKLYPVSDDLRNIDFNKVYEAKDRIMRDFPSLAESNNESNYLERMQLGLYLEEIALEQAFQGYRIAKTRFENVGDFLRLPVPDVAEKRPSLLVGDKVEATDASCTDNYRPIGPIYRGLIQKIENDAILVKFPQQLFEKHHGKVFSVEFFFSRSPLRQQHHALEEICSPRGLAYEVLFPKPGQLPLKDPRLCVTLEGDHLKLLHQQRQWFHKNLNEYQRQAVVNVLRGECRPLPYIIYGPPGMLKEIFENFKF